jgi:hypothetical protein
MVNFIHPQLKKARAQRSLLPLFSFFFPLQYYHVCCV